MATAPAAPKPAAAPAPAPAPAPNNATVNGVNWSMPPAESVVYPVVSPANEFATAMYDAPQQVAQQQAQTAEAQATSQMAPLQVQEAKARIAQQQMETDDAMLQRILPVFQNNPQIAQSPQVQALLGPIMQRRGLDPKDPGSIQAVLQPPLKPLTEASADVIEKGLELPPGAARQAYFSPYSGVPESVYNAPQVKNEAAITAFNTQLNKVYLDATSGKMTAQQFAAWLDLNRDNIVQAGMDPSALEKNPAIIAGIAPALQVKLDQLKLLGGKYAIDAQKAEADIRRATSVSDLNAIRAKYLGQQQAILPLRAQAALQNAQANTERAAAYSAQVQQNIANAQNGSWTARQGILGKDMGQVIAMRRQAELDYRQLTIAAQTARNNGEDPGDELMGAIADAKARVDQFTDLQQQMRDPSTANAAVGKLASQASGQQVKVEGGAPQFNASQIVARSKSNPAIVKMQDGSIWDTSAQPPRLISK